MYSVGTNYTSLAQLLMHRIKQHVKQGSNMSFQISQSVHILNAYFQYSFMQFLVRNVRYIIIAYIIGTCKLCSHVRLDMDQARTKPPRVWVGIATGLGGLVTACRSFPKINQLMHSHFPYSKIYSMQLQTRFSFFHPVRQYAISVS